jgi:hypothetical protein
MVFEFGVCRPGARNPDLKHWAALLSFVRLL